ncbi:MAG TPA: hypothetical protein VGS07_30495 [Thermoanaerobaculia bacterium]|jgi:hypothetical protein|nr:hypothetical protein [Thermoanaerobaculia bacterium]
MTLTPQVHAAKRGAPATVALDLRCAGQAAAVAVDGRGALAAWAVFADGGDALALARRAVRELRVRPREVRVLLGAPGTSARDEVQVAVLTRAAPATPAVVPGEAEIAAALFAEGYERLNEPSVAALATSPATWLVAACAAAVIEPLAAGLLAESGTEPAFVVDQLLAAASLEAGSAGVEPGEALPAECELAWRLALCPAVPRLASRRSERRRTSLAWARRATRAALVLAALGVLLMAAGLRLAWRNRALAPQAAGDARLVGKLREIGALAEEAGRLRAGLAGQTAPWPRLAEPVAALARQLPPEVGWERLQVKDGALELEASAAGPELVARLESLRRALERSPELANLSWAAPTAEKHGNRLHQVFRATVAPKGAP